MAESELVITGLRQATATHHQAIDALLRLDASVDMARYRRVLQGFDAFLSTWESSISRQLPERLRPWFASRSRGAMARRDLRALETARLPRVPAMPFIDSAAAAFGSLYVLEGSALGGQVIARGLKEHHGLGQDNGAAYFAGWGEATGAHWREFREMLESEVGTGGEERAQARAAAVATFDALAATFREHADAAAA